MKRGWFLRVIFLFIFILLISSLFFYIFFIRNFSQSIRPLTDSEKQDVTNILIKNVNISGYKIEFGDVIILNNTRLAQVKLINATLTKSYLVNIENQIVLRK